jgi:hypothetical protein
MLISSLTVTWRVLRETSDTALQKAATEDRPLASRKVWDFPQFERVIFAVALALQGPVIAWLGGFHGAGAVGFIVLFLAAAAGVLLWSRERAWSPAARMTMAMFSVGGLAMLAGWWADAGFAAVVRDGVCLCGCAQSNMGLGLLAKFTWMDAGMLLAALPGLFVDKDIFRSVSSRVWCWIAGLVGMFLGMEIGAIARTPPRPSSSSPSPPWSSGCVWACWPVVKSRDVWRCANDDTAGIHPRSCAPERRRGESTAKRRANAAALDPMGSRNRRLEPQPRTA